ncbi:hypothetical protein LMG19083_04748 [Ralstonia psammae]|uniref:Copper resistance protein n=1 Tax=Ralstonia psammae TaxID=3058598 RepID=A0ABM9JYN1_9RALS|nr:copper resistance protein [Ralstonia sp. LMG 19083]CAJ0808663.1 hypothetical protein LMG19083_04748 [Ralstonia sp. LMG 19083]
MRALSRRLWLACFLALTFLTVQLAAAAYACAGERFAVGQAVEMHEMGDMSESCPEMAQSPSKDTGQHDGLCLEHCQASHKSADHVAPQIPTFLPVLVRMVEPTPVAIAVPQALALGDAVARAPPPPLSILHCCFRT